MLTQEQQQELLNLARWISRCAAMQGPVGTTAYFIKPDVMSQLRLLVNYIDIQQTCKA